MWFQRVTVLLGLLCTSAIAAPRADADNTKIRILHNNDMHARFEQTDARGGTCKNPDFITNKCYGGFARVAHV